MKPFKILYILCLLGTIVFGDIHVFSIIIVRYIAVFAMFLLCIREKVSFPGRAVYYFYYFFLLLFFLMSAADGYLYDFIVVFIGSYFVSIVWIWATYVLIKKYDCIDIFVNTIICVCIINALITIAQYYNYTVAFGIPYLLEAVNRDVIDSYADHSVDSDYLGGMAIFGIFGAVPNGYYLAVASVLVSSLYNKSKTLFKKIVSLFLFFIVLFSLFCCQERAALVGGAFFSLLYLAKSFFSNLKSNAPIIALLLVAILVFGSINFDSSSFVEGTRYEDFGNMDTRTRLFSISRDYILQHPLTANLFEFINTYHLYPHHIIYYSIMCGTMIGGVIILGCLIYILFLALRIAIKKMGMKYDDYITISFALFAYCVPSLTHNDSIASGATMFWILATAVITASSKNKLRKRYQLRIKTTASN